MRCALVAVGAVALLAAVPVKPLDEAEDLGRKLAANGALVTMLPAMGAKETEEIVKAHPGLSDAEKDRLRATARHVLDQERERLVQAAGHEYALALSLTDLRSLVASNDSQVARRYRAAMPQVTMKAFAALGNIDFKGDVSKAYCAESGKLCGK